MSILCKVTGEAVPVLLCELDQLCLGACLATIASLACESTKLILHLFGVHSKRLCDSMSCGRATGGGLTRVGLGISSESTWEGMTVNARVLANLLVSALSFA